MGYDALQSYRGGVMGIVQGGFRSRVAWLLAAACGIAGCGTFPTSIDAQWVNPAFAGTHAVRSMLVMAAVSDATYRRLFEDRMSAALKAAGVDAVASYTVLPQDGPADEERLRQAVAAAGRPFVLVTRVTGVFNQVNSAPPMVVAPAWGPGWAPGWGGFAGHYNGGWGGGVVVAGQVWTTQFLQADTRVFDAGTAVVSWSAATSTAIGYRPVPEAIDQFVGLLVDTLKRDGVI
jgi:hypothetical protein